MERLSIKNGEDLKDFIDGCTLLGVGGGGNPKEGFNVLYDAIKKQGPIEWKDVKEIDDESIAICTFLMGSTAPLTKEKLKKKEELGLTHLKYSQNLVNAVMEWEKYTGKNVDVIYPLEVGGSNMPVPIAVAKKLGKTIVDGDCAGRAIPEIFQISLMLENVPFWPAVSVDKYGNICIIKEAISLTIAERIGKYLSEVAFGSTGIAGFPVTGKQLKRLLIKGTVSRAYRLGRALNFAREEKKCLSKEMEKYGGKLIFKGQVIKKDWKDEEGYYSGFYSIEGKEEFSGNVLKIYFKNENHIAWKNEKSIVSSPDLICCVDYKDKRPLLNDQINVSSNVEVYAFPCDPILRKKEVIKWICPKYFGFDIKYKAI